MDTRVVIYFGRAGNYQVLMRYYTEGTYYYWFPPYKSIIKTKVLICSRGLSQIAAVVDKWSNFLEPDDEGG